jgi:hypothetical protein
MFSFDFPPSFPFICSRTDFYSAILSLHFTFIIFLKREELGVKLMLCRGLIWNSQSVFIGCVENMA